MTTVVLLHAACGLLYLVLAVSLAIRWGRNLPGLVLSVTCAIAGLWGGAVALQNGLAPGSSTAAALAPIVGALDVLQVGGWLASLAAIYWSGLPEGGSRGFAWALGLCAVVIGHELFTGAVVPSSAGAGLFALASRVLLAIVGLMLVEALLRQLPDAMRWRLKYLCLGVGAILAYDLFVWSEALLLRRIDPVLYAGRAVTAALAIPMLAVAALRNPHWPDDLRVARPALVHTLTLFGVGLYLLALAGAAAALRSFESEWGRLFQAVFLLGAVMLLAMIWLSPVARSVWRQQLSRYLFTERHDYRMQWQRFADSLSAAEQGESLHNRALRAVAETVDSRSGGLWLRESDVYALVADLALPEEAKDESLDGGMIDEIWKRQDEVLKLTAGAEAESLDAEPWLPDWLRAWKAAWVLLPLPHREDLLGFIVLARPPGRRELHWEDEELLGIVARQVASYLAEEQKTRALEESRRFADLSRRFAFIAHDLRNLANELGLSLANARTHIQKPEFQRDLMLSMEDTVAGMQRLLDRLSGQGEERVHTTSDLAVLFGTALRSRFGDSSTVRLELETDSPLHVVGDPDRLLAMSGHLIRNAIDASGPEGHVIVRMRRLRDQALFEVEDDGPGMTREFLRERLHHPFGSSKPSGFGIGLYECRELARELGGQLSLEPALGHGTRASVRLPLAQAAQKDWEPIRALG